MPEMNIPLFDLRLSAEATRQVRDVMQSGWLNTGPKAKALEQAIAGMTRVRHAAAVSSATEGLQLTLEALGAGPGREVITTPFTFVATAAAIIHTGATPVFADIDPVTLNLDPEDVARRITSRTMAILPVDVAGLPADYRSLAAICKPKKLSLVADAAHSLWARVGSKSVAQLADVAVYSFQATKNLTTADGGMVVSRHKDVVARVRLLARHGMTSDAYQRRNSRKWAYDVTDLGHKANLSDLHAAIGLGQLSVFEKNQARRELLAARYARQLNGLQDYLELPAIAPPVYHAWHLYIIRLHLARLKVDRNRFMALLADAGIETGVHYRPLFDMALFRELGYSGQSCPNAAFAGQRVMSLPLYPELKASQIDYVCDQIQSIVDRYRR